MELKFPRKVNVGPFTFEVDYNKKGAGASFSFSERKIEIGIAHIEKDQDYVFMLLCHEIMEICHVVTCTRYHDESVDANYKFFLDHKEFENNINLFSKAIQQFIK